MSGCRSHQPWWVFSVRAIFQARRQTSLEVSATAANLGPRFREDERGKGGRLALAMEQAGGFQGVFGIRNRPLAGLEDRVGCESKTSIIGPGDGN